MNVQEIELAKPPHQGPQPQLLLVAPRYRDSTRDLASTPYRAALVGKWIDVLAAGRKAENRDIDFLGEPAIDFVGPSRQSAAIVRAELLATGEQDGHRWP